jgi:membrane protein required for colicin V production
MAIGVEPKDPVPVTQFDLIALAVLAVSGLIGFGRGAVRELTTLFAFVAAVVIALLTLKYSGPLARHYLHPAWVANVAALLSVFLASYITMRALGGVLARSLGGASGLGGLDRVAGLGIGLVRGFVILGAFQLVFAAATPRDRMPRWVSRAVLYPAAADTGEILKALEPEGLAVASRLAPALKQAVGDGASDAPPRDPDDPNRTPRGRASVGEAMETQP